MPASRVRSSSRALTYRYRGHSMSDPAKYRTRDEVQHVREGATRSIACASCCSTRCIADEDRFKQIDKEIRAVVNEAASFAQDSPEPDRGAVHRRLS